MSMLRTIAIMLLLFPLTGCFVVDDFGAYWKNGRLDPKLEGKWMDMTTKGSIILIRHDDYYHYGNMNDETVIKTLMLDGASYLMMRNNDGQAMFRYTVDSDRLIVYIPNPGKKLEFDTKYVNKIENIVVEEEGYRVTTLTEEVVDALRMLGRDKGYWIQQMILMKQELPKAVE